MECRLEEASIMFLLIPSRIFLIILHAFKCDGLQQNIRSMSKLYVVLISLVLFSPLAFFLTKYVPYFLHGLKETQTIDPVIHLSTNTSLKVSERLGYLQELTSLPVVGQLFLEQKIAELMKLGRFEDVIQKSEIAIQSPVNARSFSIWYHRALSQCLMKQFEECESSLSQATLYTNGYTENFVQGIYSLLEQLSSLEQAEKDSKDTNHPGIPFGNMIVPGPKAVKADSYEEL